MNARQMLLDYAAQKNDGKVYNNEQFIGKAMTEGIRISDTSEGGIVVANIKREGKTIIVTETTKVDTLKGKETTTVEIFRVSL